MLLSALTALREGRAITHLHAWVWQVARHRYAAWAAQKRHRRENEAAPDEVDSIPSPGDPLDDTLRLPAKPETSTVGMWIELR